MSQVPENVRTWHYACDKHHLLSASWSPPSPFLRLDPVLAERILSLSGKEKASFKEGVHLVLDAIMRAWYRSYMTGGWKGPSKCKAQSHDIEGTPLRIRVNHAYNVTVDVIGNGGILSGDQIMIDGNLPLSVQEACVGKRVDQIIANDEGFFDGSRTVLSAFTRMGKNTVMNVSKSEEKAITYSSMFGDPKKRFAKKYPTHVSISQRDTNYQG